MPFQKGHKKIAGREKGTTNKVNALVADILQAKNMNLVDEAMGLYNFSADPEFKLRVLSLLFPYVYPKRTDPIPDDSIDITPETELSLAKETIQQILKKYPRLLDE
jgi:hypothetical protein